MNAGRERVIYHLLIFPITVPLCPDVLRRIRTGPTSVSWSSSPLHGHVPTPVPAAGRGISVIAHPTETLLVQASAVSVRRAADDPAHQ